MYTKENTYLTHADHKYIRKYKGPSGKWVYIYADSLSGSAKNRSDRLSNIKVNDMKTVGDKISDFANKTAKNIKNKARAVSASAKAELRYAKNNYKKKQEQKAKQKAADQFAEEKGGAYEIGYNLAKKAKQHSNQLKKDIEKKKKKKKTKKKVDKFIKNIKNIGKKYK